MLFTSSFSSSFHFIFFFGCYNVIFFGVFCFLISCVIIVTAYHSLWLPFNFAAPNSTMHYRWKHCYGFCTIFQIRRMIFVTNVVLAGYVLYFQYLFSPFSIHFILCFSIHLFVHLSCIFSYRFCVRFIRYINFHMLPMLRAMRSSVLILFHHSNISEEYISLRENR